MATVRLIWIHPSTLDDFRESYQADNQPVPGYWHWMMSFHILTGSQDEIHPMYDGFWLVDQPLFTYYYS